MRRAAALLRGGARGKARLQRPERQRADTAAMRTLQSKFVRQTRFILVPPDLPPARDCLSVCPTVPATKQQS